MIQRADARHFPVSLRQVGCVSFVALIIPNVEARADQTDVSQSLAIPMITVEESAPAKAPMWFDRVTDTPATTYQVGGEGIKAFGGPGGDNPYRAISTLPSVYAADIDPYGLANIPGGLKGLRVRGEQTPHGGTGTVEGLPLTGANPGPGYLWMFDMENFASVQSSQGPIAPDKPSLFTTAGVLDSSLRWPSEKMGFEASQSVGSYNFRRSFARADSGEIDHLAATSLSASYTDADKWRGPGQSADGRKNIEWGTKATLSDNMEGKFYAIYNDIAQYNYRALTYSQASNLSQYNKFDFSTSSSSVAANAVNYYKYNRQSFTNAGFLSEFAYDVNPNTRVVVKPYYMNENGEYFDGMANGKVRNWLIDHDWYGLSSELQTHLMQSDVKVGYWWTTMDPPGPPTAWKMYNTTANGGLGTATWSILAKVVDRHEFHNIYAEADHRFDKLRVQAGVRYVRETMPGINEYSTSGLGDVSYETALSSSSGVIANQSVTAFTVDEVLPYTAASYDLAPNVQLKASLGRNYGPPDIAVWPTFQQNAATFLAKGLTADKLWHAMKPETSTAVDTGVRWTFGEASIEPTLYYAKYYNKGVAYDPGVGVAYDQNVAESHAYGAQAVARWSPVHGLELFNSLSYDRNVFDKALPTLAGASAATVAVAQSVKGKQLPDVPVWMATLGAAWHIDEVIVSPQVHVMSSRYGDSAHTQPISGYATVDLNIDYVHEMPSGPIDIGLSVTNLLDRRYIGDINTGYLQQTSGTNAYYYQGAPRTIVGKVAVKF